jgi:formate dehydrogenase iron-sulfur subunit
MCFDRVDAGGLPACVEACPFEATVFGERDELIAEAEKRIEEHPGDYVDHIYGVQEAGGTSVLFLSSIPFEKLGFPVNLPAEPIPQLSWKILREIPKYSVVASVFLFGIHWITARRAYVAKLEAEQKGEERKNP